MSYKPLIRESIGNLLAWLTWVVIFAAFGTIPIDAISGEKSSVITAFLVGVFLERVLAAVLFVSDRIRSLRAYHLQR